MRHVCGLMLILIAVPLVRADAGLPNFGPRYFLAQYKATFEGLEKYPDFTFFVLPVGAAPVTPGGGPNVIHVDYRLAAVPKVLAQDSTVWRSKWDPAPGVLYSTSLLTGEKRIQAASPPTVVLHFRVELTKDELKCVKLSEEEHIPPDNRPTARAVIAGICGGLVLTVVIAVVGLVWIVRRISRGSRT